MKNDNSNELNKNCVCESFCPWDFERPNYECTGCPYIVQSGVTKFGFIKYTCRCTCQDYVAP